MLPGAQSPEEQKYYVGDLRWNGDLIVYSNFSFLQIILQNNLVLHNLYFPVNRLLLLVLRLYSGFSCIPKKEVLLRGQCL